MAVKTADMSELTSLSQVGDSQRSITSTNDGEYRDTVVAMNKKTVTKSLNILGKEAVDLQITVDYSATFYPADLTLTAASSIKKPKA